VIVDHHSLRLAFGSFLAAKRTLCQAYREFEASQIGAESGPMLEWGAADRDADDSVLSEVLRDLKVENEKLRKSLDLLHSYTLRVQEQCDALVTHRDKLLGTCEDVAFWIRGHYRANEYPRSLLEQLDEAIGIAPTRKSA
jgi:hypothetical protein